MFALYLYSAPAAFAQCDGTELTITLDFDSFAAEASWELTSDSGDIIASGVGTVNNSSETATACVTDGCYTFTMNDSWGDGGTAYSVADPDGNVLASAGASDYASTTSADFCIGDVAIPGCTDETA